MAKKDTNDNEQGRDAEPGEYDSVDPALMQSLTDDIVESDIDWSDVPTFDNNGNMVLQKEQTEGEDQDDEEVDPDGAKAEDDDQEAEDDQEDEEEEEPPKAKKKDKRRKLEEDGDDEGEEDFEDAPKAADVKALSKTLEVYKNQIAQYNGIVEKMSMPSGDPEAIAKEMAEIDKQIDEEGDEMTPAELHKLQRRQTALEKQAAEIENSRSQIQQFKNYQERLRAESDAAAVRQFPFIQDPKSEYYKVLKEQAYPLLSQIVPNFQSLPYDLPLAAQVAELMVDAQNYKKIKSGKKSSRRRNPAKLAGDSGVTQSKSSSSSKRPYNKKKLVKDMAEGRMDVVGVLDRMGVGWESPI